MPQIADDDIYTEIETRDATHRSPCALAAAFAPFTNDCRLPRPRAGA